MNKINQLYYALELPERKVFKAKFKTLAGLLSDNTFYKKVRPSYKPTILEENGAELVLDEINDSK